jgi:hypothetical protein
MGFSPVLVGDSVEGCPAKNQPLHCAKPALLGYAGMRLAPGNARSGKQEQESKNRENK